MPMMLQQVAHYGILRPGRPCCRLLVPPMGTLSTWLVVKPQHEKYDAKELFSGTGIGKTSEGKRHLGAALESRSFLESYVSNKVKVWTSVILNLSLIAKTQPHAAYCAFVHGVSWVWTFFLRTIPDISSLLQPLVRHV